MSKYFVSKAIVYYHPSREKLLRLRRVIHYLKINHSRFTKEYPTIIIEK